MISRYAAALPFLLLLFLSGCASTSDIDPMRADINQLKRETFEMKKDVNTMKQLITGAAKEETFNALRESQTSLYSQVSDISKDLQVLRGRFDENKFFIDKSLKETAAERELFRSQISSLETRVKDLNEKIARLGVESPPVRKPLTEDQEIKDEGERPREEPAKAPKTSGDENFENDPIKAYDAAYKLFKEKHYKEAREKFNAFIKRFPKDDLTDSAQFWIAETYYAEKDFEGAILSYESLLKTYPRSRKTAPALYKQGLSFIELGDTKTAKVILQKLVEKHPDTKEAEQAKKKLAEIDKKPAKTKPKR